MTTNSYVIEWIEEMKALVKPEEVIWIDGSESQLENLRKEAVLTGEIIKLNEEKLPGCYLHRTNPNDVARAENKTFICTKSKEEAGPTNNWKDPKETYKMLYEIAKDSYKNKKMYIIPYSMGIIGGKYSKIGVEITNSIYTVLNMAIMTRVGNEVWQVLGESDDWVKGLHSSCNMDEDKRYVCHFPDDKTIISVNSCYGGNVLLGKKCFALRIASHLGRKEGWMAEHMLILGIQNPQGEVKYICAAFPSACGKTNLAMLVPPEAYKEKGWKVWCIGDDIAWIHIGKDGRLWAMNPENGFFGVAPGTSIKSNPNAFLATKSNTIFTNVVYNLDNNTVWWEGYGEEAPKNAIDWLGNAWNGEKSDKKRAHPNSRFTSPARNCPCLGKEFDGPEGVPISAIIFGGRRAQTTPLIYEAENWEHGVFIGATSASESTAASTGKVGVLKHDPMAMRPFCGYNMGQYFKYWLEIGKKLGEKAPKIFSVNWFRQDENGKFIWPGFGENIRALEWVLKRCENKVDAKKTEIGFMPNTNNINFDGLDLTDKEIQNLISIDKNLWKKENENTEKFLKSFGKDLPKELTKRLEILKSRF